jgi:hypothetical protein
MACSSKFTHVDFGWLMVWLKLLLISVPFCVEHATLNIISTTVALINSFAQVLHYMKSYSIRCHCFRAKQNQPLLERKVSLKSQVNPAYRSNYRCTFNFQSFSCVTNFVFDVIINS